MRHGEERESGGTRNEQGVAQDDPETGPDQAAESCGVDVEAELIEVVTPLLGVMGLDGDARRPGRSPERNPCQGIDDRRRDQPGQCGKPRGELTGGACLDAIGTLADLQRRGRVHHDAWRHYDICRRPRRCERGRQQPGCGRCRPFGVGKVAESFVIDHERALSDPDGLASVAVNGDGENTGRTDHQVIEGQRVVPRCNVATDGHRMHNGPLAPERGEGICKGDLCKCSAVGTPCVTREWIDSEEARDQRNGRSFCLKCKALP